MHIKGLLFDINGTLTDIKTDEGYEDIYRTLSNLLSYQGIIIDAKTLKSQYFQIMDKQLAASETRHPEFDAVAIFAEILGLQATAYTQQLAPEKLQMLPLFLAETFRAASRFRLQLYPGVAETIKQLHDRYRLAIVSDGQTAYARPELNAVELSQYFNPVIISGDFGYRKPDKRLFRKALTALAMTPDEVLFIGNDMYRDVHGPRKLGIRTVFFRSNQGQQEKEGVQPDYIIHSFPELLDAIAYFER
ncbi:MAG: HAD family hydrolase [Deltaproteobacteria bacterium]|nr:HAD family hydrolase [Deltaproteobacteria bacterium]